MLGNNSKIKYHLSLALIPIGEGYTNSVLKKKEETAFLQSLLSALRSILPSFV